MSENTNKGNDLARALGAISGPLVGKNGLDAFTLAWAADQINAIGPSGGISGEMIEALDYLSQLRERGLLEHEECSKMHELICAIPRSGPGLDSVKLTSELAEMLYDDQTGTVGRFNSSVYKHTWLRRIAAVVARVVGA